MHVIAYVCMYVWHGVESRRAKRGPARPRRMEQRRSDPRAPTVPPTACGTGSSRDERSEDRHDPGEWSDDVRTHELRPFHRARPNVPATPSRTSSLHSPGSLRSRLRRLRIRPRATPMWCPRARYNDGPPDGCHGVESGRAKRGTARPRRTEQTTFGPTNPVHRIEHVRTSVVGSGEPRARRTTAASRHVSDAHTRSDSRHTRLLIPPLPETPAGAARSGHRGRRRRGGGRRWSSRSRTDPQRSSTAASTRRAN